MRIIIADGEKSISKTVRSMFPLVDESMLRRAFLQRDFRVNKKREGRDVTLNAGDELAVYIDDRYLLPAPDIIFIDENVLIVNKPYGVETEEYGRSISLSLGRVVIPVHRLDATTTGLIVFALRDAAEKELLSAFARHDIKKTYRCIVKGTPEKNTNRLVHYLVKNSEQAFVTAYDSPRAGALTAILSYNMIETYNEKSLLEIDLETGRTHQIRVQLAKIGHPVLGDDKYGDREFNRAADGKRLRLCSCAVEFGFVGGALGYLSGKRFELAPPFTLSQ